MWLYYQLYIDIISSKIQGSDTIITFVGHLSYLYAIVKCSLLTYYIQNVCMENLLYNFYKNYILGCALIITWYIYCMWCLHDYFQKQGFDFQ